MPRVPYAELIQESGGGAAAQARTRMLRLLKKGQITSLHASAPFLGYSLNQLYRCRTVYQHAGLARLLEVHPRPGRPAKQMPAAWTGIEAEMRTDRHPP